MGGARREHANCACNLIWLCAKCHREVESKREIAREYGYAVTQSADDPYRYPILCKGKWSLLTCDGRMIALAS